MESTGGVCLSAASEYPSYLVLYRRGILSKRVDQLQAYYKNCTLCPRDCRVDRTQDHLGKCRATSTVKVSSAFAHFGEEQPLVGTRGSGTIFFSNCALRCLYCQNHSISIEGTGTQISDERLAGFMIRLQESGCHNINLVSPTHYLPSILNAIKIAVPLGLTLPVVYNTGGYERPEILKFLDGIVDIYLPDIKYLNPQHAAQYSSEAYNYPFYVKVALKEMFLQVGDLATDKEGVAQRGLMIRHLVLPHRISDTRKALKFIVEELSTTTYVNIMDQYRPAFKAHGFSEINRRITQEEYREALVWAKEVGLTNLA